MPFTPEQQQKAKKLASPLPLLAAILLVGWYFLFPIPSVAEYAPVAETEAATAEAARLSREIAAVLGEDFASLSPSEQAARIAALSAADQTVLAGLVTDLQQALSTAAAQAGVATEESATGQTSTTDTQQALTALSQLQESTAATLAAIAQAAPADSTLAQAATDAVAATQAEQTAVEQLLAALAQALVDGGMSAEEAAALVSALSEHLGTALENASEQGLEGIRNAMEAQAANAQRKADASAGGTASGTTSGSGTASGSGSGSAGNGSSGVIDGRIPESDPMYGR